MRDRPFYGTKDMSPLLRISQKLHDEVQEVLYTQFAFRFEKKVTCTVLQLNTVIRRLSARARELICDVMIGVEFVFDFGNVSRRVSEEMCIQRVVECVAEDKARLETIKTSFPAISRVRIELSFDGQVSSSDKYYVKMKEACVLGVMDLVGVFEGGKVEIVLVKEPLPDTEKNVEDHANVAKQVTREDTMKRDIVSHCWQKMGLCIEAGRIGLGSRVEVGKVEPGQPPKRKRLKSFFN